MANTFQSSLVQYAGFTGTTGGIYIPTQVAGGAGGLQLAGTLTVSSPTNLIEFPIPTTAKNVIITAASFTHTGTQVGVFIGNNTGTIGLDIQPAGTTDNDLLCQSYSPDGKTWCGEVRVGKQPPSSGPDGTIGETISGTLLLPATKALMTSVDGNITAGIVSIFYQ